MNDYNQQVLKNQIEFKKNKQNSGMSDQEYLLNRQLLEKAATNMNK